MSERMKKHLIDSIEITFNDRWGTKLLVPSATATKLRLQLKKYLKRTPEQDPDDESVPADEVFADLYDKYGKVGTTLRGLRYREDLTQEELAKKLKIRQTHISEIEHGKRSVGKALAKKLGVLFNIDYRLFL